MFGSSVLDIGIGLILVFLVLSLVCTAANELLAGLFGWRAASCTPTRQPNECPIQMRGFTGNVAIQDAIASA